MNSSISLLDSGERSKTPKKEFPAMNPNLLYSHSSRKSDYCLSERTKDNDDWDHRRHSEVSTEIENFLEPIRSLHEKMQSEMAAGRLNASLLETLQHHLKLIKDYAVRKRISEKRLDRLLSQQFDPETHMFLKLIIFGFIDQNSIDKSIDHLTRSNNTPSHLSNIEPFTASPDHGIDINELYNNIELMRQKLFEMKTVLTGYEGSMTEISAEGAEIITSMNQFIEALSKRADNFESFYHDSSSQVSLMGQKLEQLMKEISMYKKRNEAQRQELDSVRTQAGELTRKP